VVPERAIVVSAKCPQNDAVSGSKIPGIASATPRGTMAKKKAKRRGGFKTAFYRYRTPFEERPGEWWVRKRELVTGKVERVRLKDATGPESALEAVAKLLVEDNQRLSKQGAEPGKPIPPGKLNRASLTVRDALDAWLASKQVSEESMTGYKRDSRKYAVVLGPSRLVATITTPDVREGIMQRWPHRKNRIMKSGRSMRKHKNAMAEFFSFLQKDLKVIDENPVDGWKEPKAWATQQALASRETGQEIKPDELGRLLDKATGEMHLYVVLAVATGLRKSNLIGSDFKQGLLWGDVKHLLDPAQAKIFIAAKRMKWKESNFDNVIHEEARQALVAHRAGLGRVPSDGDPVFSMSYSDLRDEWSALQKRAGIDPPKRIHDLRHSAISRWERYVGSVAICHQLEHHSPAGNVRAAYTHVDEEEVRAALAKVPRVGETTVEMTAAQKKA
jgi:integrase